MPERSWHGWSRGAATLHIGPMPGRKSIALYSMVGSVMYVHAYFRDETEAERALNVIDLITSGETLVPGIWAENGDGGEHHRPHLP